MVSGLDVLARQTKHKKPTNTQMIYHLFISNGITPKQIHEEFTIPEIIEFVNTELYVQELKLKAQRKKK